MDEFVAGTLHTAHLDYAVVLAHCLYNLLAFIDGKSHRLLQEDVLPRLAGGYGDDCVLMVRNGNNYGVDVRPCQDVLVVFVYVHIHFFLPFSLVELPDDAGKAVALDVIDVTASHNAHVLHWEEEVQQHQYLLPQAYESQGDFVVSRLFLVAGCCRGGGCRRFRQGGRQHQAGSAHGGNFQEVSSFHISVIISFVLVRLFRPDNRVYRMNIAIFPQTTSIPYREPGLFVPAEGIDGLYAH